MSFQTRTNQRRLHTIGITIPKEEAGRPHDVILPSTIARVTAFGIKRSGLSTPSTRSFAERLLSEDPAQYHLNTLLFYNRNPIASGGCARRDNTFPDSREGLWVFLRCPSKMILCSSTVSDIVGSSANPLFCALWFEPNLYCGIPHEHRETCLLYQLSGLGYIGGSAPLRYHSVFRVHRHNTSLLDHRHLQMCSFRLFQVRADIGEGVES